MALSNLSFSDFGALSMNDFATLLLFPVGITFQIEAQAISGGLGCDECMPFGEVVAGASFTLLARISGADGSYLTQSDVSSVKVDVTDEDKQDCVRVWRCDDPPPVSPDPFYIPAVSAVIFDTLQTDERWDRDSVGFNLAYEMELPLSDHMYDVVITLTTTGGEHLKVAYEVLIR